jgi:hypothetical protein
MGGVCSLPTTGEKEKGSKSYPPGAFMPTGGEIKKRRVIW